MTDLLLPNGKNLMDGSKDIPLLFVFVRHKGCTFCREALSQLSEYKEKLLQKRVKVFVVHMGPESTSQELEATYKLQGVTFISDPQKKFYKAFGLKRGSLNQLFGPKIWLRGFQAGVLQGHGIGAIEGDGLQLGGICLLKNGSLTKLLDPCDAADIGDWNNLLTLLDKNL